MQDKIIAMEETELEVGEKFRLVHELLLSKPSALEREHHSVLSVLYQVVPALDFIPKRLWTKVNEMLRSRTVRRGKKLISQSTINPPCYIILTGTFEIVLKNQEKAAQIGPGSICGDYYILNEKRWRPANVVAVENSSVAEFSANSLHQLILEENSSQQFKSLISFLKDAVPEYELLSRHSQERLARFFKERTFYPGQLLIKEGTAANSAFLIREGVCDIISFNTPLIPSKLFQPTRTTLKVERTKVRRAASHKMNGYMCKSTTMYQFNSAASKNWVGDDIILGESSYRYSAVARTKVVGLEIARENLKKLTPELARNLEENARAKKAVQSVRKSKLERNLTDIYNMNPKFISEDRFRASGNEMKGEHGRRETRSEQRTKRPLSKANNSFHAQFNIGPKLSSSFALAALKPRKRVLKVASLFSTRTQRLRPIFYHRPVVTEYEECLRRMSSMHATQVFSRSALNKREDLSDIRIDVADRKFMSYSSAKKKSNKTDLLNNHNIIH